MRTTSWLCLAFFLLTSASVGSAQAPGFYVQHGRSITWTPNGDAEHVRNLRIWQIRLYERGRAASGDRHWGLISGPTLKSVLDQLQSHQDAQLSIERFFQKPEKSSQYGYFNHLGPIAVVKLDVNKLGTLDKFLLYIRKDDRRFAGNSLDSPEFRSLLERTGRALQLAKGALASHARFMKQTDAFKNVTRSGMSGTLAREYVSLLETAHKQTAIVERIARKDVISMYGLSNAIADLESSIAQSDALRDRVAAGLPRPAPTGRSGPRPLDARRVPPRAVESVAPRADIKRFVGSWTGWHHAVKVQVTMTQQGDDLVIHFAMSEGFEAIYNKLEERDFGWFRLQEQRCVRTDPGRYCMPFAYLLEQPGTAF